MRDLGSDHGLADVWSNTAATMMNSAMALGVTNAGAIVDFWSTAAGMSSPAKDTRTLSRSTARPWYRAPEPPVNPFDMTAWMGMFAPPPPPPAPVNPFAAFWPGYAPAPYNPFAQFNAFASAGNPMAAWGAMTPFAATATGSSPASAVVPGLMALAAAGMAAQQLLGMIETTRQWQSPMPAAAAPPVRRFYPSYRSDSGHAVANIVMPETVVAAAVTMPMNGLAIMLRAMQIASGR